MAKCKMDGCREEAVYGSGWGHKRYCLVHGTAYAKKQRVYLEIQETLRDCECCGQKLSKSHHDMGLTTCGACEAELGRQRAEQWKEESLDNASTVEDLKAWIKEHMLK